jgi:hypothetical protein
MLVPRKVKAMFAEVVQVHGGLDVVRVALEV